MGSLGTISAGQLSNEKSTETDQFWGSRAHRIDKNRQFVGVWGVLGGSGGEVLETMFGWLVFGGSRVGPGVHVGNHFCIFFASGRFWEQLLEGPGGNSKLARILMQKSSQQGTWKEAKCEL